MSTTDFLSGLITRMWLIDFGDPFTRDRVATRICRRILEHIPAIHPNHPFKKVNQMQMQEKFALDSLLHQTEAMLGKWYECVIQSRKFVGEQNNKENQLVLCCDMPEAPQNSNTLDEIAIFNMHYNIELDRISASVQIIPVPTDEEIIDRLISKEIVIATLLDELLENKEYIEQYHVQYADLQARYGMP